MVPFMCLVTLVGSTSVRNLLRVCFKDEVMGSLFQRDSLSKTLTNSRRLFTLR